MATVNSASRRIILVILDVIELSTEELCPEPHAPRTKLEESKDLSREKYRAPETRC